MKSIVLIISILSCLIALGQNEVNSVTVDWRKDVVINSFLNEMYIQVKELEIGNDQNHVTALSRINRY